MGSNIIKVLPKVLVRTVVEVELKIGRHLDNKVGRNRSTRAVHPRYQQTNRPLIGGGSVPSCSASMARWGSRLRAGGNSLFLDDPWFAHLQI